MSSPSQLMTNCPYCGEHLEMPVEHLGQSAVCPSCQGPFNVSSQPKTHVIPDPRAPVQQQKESSKLIQAGVIVLTLLAIGATKSFFDSHKAELNSAVHTIISFVAGNAKHTDLDSAAAHFQTGDLDSALADCNQAIRLNPRSSDAYQLRGIIYLKKGNLDGAVADCTETIHLNPKDANIYCFRGMAYVGKGEYDKAVTDCSEAIRVDPKLANAYVVRAGAYEGKGDFSRAIGDCAEAIRLEPNNAAARATRGSAYLRMGDLNKAIADLNEAIHQNPQYGEAYWVRGVTYEQRGDSKQAKLDFEQAEKLGFKAPPGIAANFTKDKAVLSPIHEAVRAKDANAVRSLVRNNPACLGDMEQDSDGFTPLHTACERGFRDMADLLLALGADVNVRARNGETPLITAIAERGDDNLELALLFIARGADVKAASNEGWTALHYAANENMPTLAQILIDRGAVVDARTMNGETPLHIAARQGRNKEVMNILLKNGADPNAHRKDGKTPFELK
jgi:tetratricopeptide (TPR) repeat protein